MRHLTIQAIREVCKIYPELAEISIFIETGTYKGGTTFPMSKHFKHVYTVEINKKAHDLCQQYALKNNIKNVTFFLGDSSQKLPEMIKLAGSAGANAGKLYFLDGHVTQNGTGLTGKGVYDVPLLLELQAIDTFDPAPSVIFIDDMRLFGENDKTKCAGADWSQITLQNILNQFTAGRIKKHFVDPSFNSTSNKLENDRYVIVLNAKTA